ncbi:hypothetical protein SVIOM342S_04094 [Streptomyces violaceorubidus]
MRAPPPRPASWRPGRGEPGASSRHRSPRRRLCSRRGAGNRARIPPRGAGPRWSLPPRRRHRPRRTAGPLHRRAGRRAPRPPRARSASSPEARASILARKARCRHGPTGGRPRFRRCSASSRSPPSVASCVDAKGLPPASRTMLRVVGLVGERRHGRHKLPRALVAQAVDPHVGHAFPGPGSRIAVDRRARRPRDALPHVGRRTPGTARWPRRATARRPPRRARAAARRVRRSAATARPPTTRRSVGSPLSPSAVRTAAAWAVASSSTRSASGRSSPCSPAKARSDSARVAEWLSRTKSAAWPCTWRSRADLPIPRLARHRERAAARRGPA